MYDPPHCEKRENPAKHPARIDDSFQHQRHNDHEIELALTFNVPRGGGDGIDTTRMVPPRRGPKHALCQAKAQPDIEN
jgi:hypothetical protein